ncbi:hypothetical protein DL765_000630 [Monosporascus sp. GIB2]|nr:hypothetical protein DL765_000630 [Monosporascus sp. GIB2]
MTSYPINSYLAINQCSDPKKGLGFFAAQRITKGLRIFSEAPILVYESKEVAMARIAADFHNLQEDSKAFVTRLFSGRQDIVPLLPAGPLRDDAAVSAERLQAIMQYNCIEGQGIGCVLAPLMGMINHHCKPNTWVYYNEAVGSMTLHALRNIDADCTSPDSDTRRSAMASLRSQLVAYYRNNTASLDDIYTAISLLRELTALIEGDGLEGLELSLAYVEQARLFDLLGDERGRRDKLRKALQFRLLCLGADHPTASRFVEDMN